MTPTPEPTPDPMTGPQASASVSSTPEAPAPTADPAALPDAHVGETTARDIQAESTSTTTDAPDPTGALPEQMAAKQAANQLGDQDAVNLAGSTLPETAGIATAENVRQYPWLFSQEVIDSFLVDDQLSDEARDEHNKAVEEHWARFNIPSSDAASESTEASTTE